MEPRPTLDAQHERNSSARDAACRNILAGANVERRNKATHRRQSAGRKPSRTAIVSPTARAITKHGAHWRRYRTVDPALRAVVRSNEYEDWPRGRMVFDRARDLFTLYADRWRRPRQRHQNDPCGSRPECLACLDIGERRPRAFTAGNPRGANAKIRGKPSAKFRMSSSLDLQKQRDEFTLAMRVRLGKDGFQLIARRLP